MPPKIRLDKLLVNRNLVPTRQKAQDMIDAGQIMVNGLPANKSGSMFPNDCQIVLKGESNPYVSRGGLKLAAGLDFFRIDPTDLICADIGASTGGFTDCLLQRGAKLVYAIDVGYGQLDWKLRQDPKVVVMERTNARNLQPADIPTPLDLAVIDAAFISLKILLPPLIPLFKDKISILALIKPQFEIGKGKVGKGGVVRDPAQHEQVIEEIKNFGKTLDLESGEIAPSPILGPSGNKEFLVHFTSS
ncbi:MAG: TlyA family RNA methyltransferase [Proteobacteria bacterium]|nr:TlyA family RNA methyltransferase [Pseudomonadota bacterium]MBU1717167.1 TlyA family RNA methyltransferase [Pseudomonadota bacterium]